MSSKAENQSDVGIQQLGTGPWEIRDSDENLVSVCYVHKYHSTLYQEFHFVEPNSNFPIDQNKYSIVQQLDMQAQIPHSATLAQKLAIFEGLVESVEGYNADFNKKCVTTNYSPNWPPLET